MLLLYLLLRAALLSNIQYLHSTMLLLYPKLGCIDCVFAVPIYIPLCFYFIQHDLRVLEYNASDLHSTMLLLYPILKCPFYSPIFNLHSTMLLLYRRTSPPLRSILPIYIPLCFYFIGFSPGSVYYYMHHLHSTMLLLYLQPVYKVERDKITFTFHYASTLSDSFTPGGSTICQFTFHYASTLSDFPSCTFNSDFYIYIPLCFYFIQNRRSSTDVRFKFTFHYASTLSASRLFLLPPFGIIYIPLCFYFIL